MSSSFVALFWEDAVDGEDVHPVRVRIDTPKVVFSRTLKKSTWPNTTLARGGLVEEIARLKAASGGDIIAYGGARFVSDLIRHRLVDEFHLFVNPAALGAGLTVLTESGRTNPLRLTGSTAFDCGVVALSYVPRADPT